MTLLYPLGLLGLIGIPVLIIIYIIKNKYTEQVISSTDLWTLSERFLKRRNPINKIAGIISLILQILAVIFISFAIAHPVFILSNAANEYCFILDGSGSMNIAQNGKTRLEIGKERIASVIKDSANGSKFSLVFVGNTTDILYEAIENKDQAVSILNGVSSAYVDAGFTGALGVAQSYFQEKPSILTYLVTDKAYESSQNVEIINVSSHETNYGIAGVEYVVSGGKIVVSGKAMSYEGDATLNLSLRFDELSEVAATQELEVKKLEETDFSFEVDNRSFSSFKVTLENEDALALDNECIVYSVEAENSYEVLIVSESPFFLEAVLSTVGNAQISVVSPEGYANVTGYDLYIFDSVNLTALPADGAVWIFNPQSSIPDAGFSVQDKLEFSESAVLSYTDEEKLSDSEAKLLKGLLKSDVAVSDYVQCGSGNFTVLMTHDGNPVLFTGLNAHGNREVVFAFDLHRSNFPAMLDFTTLSQNLLRYTFPNVIDKTSYYCGEKVQISVPAGCKSIKVDTPLGNVAYLDTNSAYSEYELTEVGNYRFTMTVGDTVRTPIRVYSSLPESERETSVTEVSFALEGEASNEKSDGKYDDMLYLFILLAVIVLADWGVYCYEQYQLR